MATCAALQYYVRIHAIRRYIERCERRQLSEDHRFSREEITRYSRLIVDRVWRARVMPPEAAAVVSRRRCEVRRTGRVRRVQPVKLIDPATFLFDGDLIYILEGTIVRTIIAPKSRQCVYFRAIMESRGGPDETWPWDKTSLFGASQRPGVVKVGGRSGGIAESGAWRLIPAELEGFDDADEDDDDEEVGPPISEPLPIPHRPANPWLQPPLPDAAMFEILCPRRTDIDAHGSLEMLAEDLGRVLDRPAVRRAMGPRIFVEGSWNRIEHAIRSSKEAKRFQAHVLPGEFSWQTFLARRRAMPGGAIVEEAFRESNVGKYRLFVCPPETASAIIGLIFAYVNKPFNPALMLRPGVLHQFRFRLGRHWGNEWWQNIPL